MVFCAGQEEKAVDALFREKGKTLAQKYPFTIRLKDRTREDSNIQPLRLKIDPGFRTTGIAVLNEADPNCGKVVFLAEIKHKDGIKSARRKKVSAPFQKK